MALPIPLAQNIIARKSAATPDAVNQFLGTHGATAIYEGTVLQNNTGPYVSQLGSLADGAIATPLSVTSCSRVQIPFNNFQGIGCDLLVGLYNALSGANPLVETVLMASEVQAIINNPTPNQIAVFAGAPVFLPILNIPPSINVNQGNVVASNGFAVYVGGYSTLSAEPSAVVVIGQLDPSAGILSWSVSATNYPTPISQHSMCDVVDATTGNHVVISVGGVTNPSSSLNSTIATVYAASVPDSGILGAWQQLTAFPTNISGSAIASWDGYVFVAGGSTDNTNGVYSPTNAVYSGQVSNEQISTWTQCSSLPVSFTFGTGAAVNGWLVVADSTNKAVYGAPVQTNGTLGTWQQFPSLPTGANNVQFTAYGDAVLATYHTGSNAYLTLAALYVTGSGPANAWNSLAQINLASSPAYNNAFPTNLIIPASDTVPAQLALIGESPTTARGGQMLELSPTCAMVSVPLPYNSSASWLVIQPIDGSTAINDMEVPLIQVSGGATAQVSQGISFGPLTTGYQIPVIATSDASGIVGRATHILRNDVGVLSAVPSTPTATHEDYFYDANGKPVMVSQTVLPQFNILNRAFASAGTTVSAPVSTMRTGGCTFAVVGLPIASSYLYTQEANEYNPILIRNAWKMTPTASSGGFNDGVYYPVTPGINYEATLVVPQDTSGITWQVTLQFTDITGASTGAFFGAVTTPTQTWNKITVSGLAGAGSVAVLMNVNFTNANLADTYIIQEMQLSALPSNSKLIAVPGCGPGIFNSNRMITYSSDGNIESVA